MELKAFLLVFITILSSCTKDKDTTVDENPQVTTGPEILGLDYAQSKNLFTATYTSLKASFDDNTNTTIVAEVDHKINAGSVDLELEPTRIIFFSNPTLETPTIAKKSISRIRFTSKSIDLPRQ